jgi:hypothetical protein
MPQQIAPIYLTFDQVRDHRLSQCEELMSQISADVSSFTSTLQYEWRSHQRQFGLFMTDYDRDAVLSSSLLSGDYVHHLRALLDGWVWEKAAAIPKGQENKVKFPSYRDNSPGLKSVLTSWGISNPNLILDAKRDPRVGGIQQVDNHYKHRAPQVAFFSLETMGWVSSPDFPDPNLLWALGNVDTEPIVQVSDPGEVDVDVALTLVLLDLPVSPHGGGEGIPEQLTWARDFVVDLIT